MRYTVLGETLFIPNFRESMIIISLPVHTFDSMPHAASGLSIISEMFPYRLGSIFGGRPGLALSRRASRPPRCVPVGQSHAALGGWNRASAMAVPAISCLLNRQAGNISAALPLPPAPVPP